MLPWVTLKRVKEFIFVQITQPRIDHFDRDNFYIRWLFSIFR